MGLTPGQQFPTRNQYSTTPASPTRHRLIPQMAGLGGIRQTLTLMRQLTAHYKTDPTIRELALRLTRNLPQKDFYGEARELWAFVKHNIRYTLDVNGVETIQTPLKTLEYGAGDCDDKALLLAALLESIGHETRFKAVGFHSGLINHVLLETNIRGKWLAMETTEPVPLGWTPPNVKQLMHG